jgi:hypothetical protein
MHSMVLAHHSEHAEDELMQVARQGLHLQHMGSGAYAECLLVALWPSTTDPLLPKTQHQH